MKLSKTISAISATTLGVISSVAGVFPASATTVPGCGEEPGGGTLTKVGSFCQVTFSQTGTSSFTLPAGVSALHGVVVGGGGGASNNGFDQRFGYAGNGGEVKYFDFTELMEGAVVDVVVGAGGESSNTPTAGEASSVKVLDRDLVSSAGGDPANGNFFCEYQSSNLVYVSMAVSGTGTQPTNSNGCDANGAAGENPSAGVNLLKWTGLAATNFGKGGGVYGTTPTTLYPGEGSSNIVDLTTPKVTFSAAQAGIVIVRWAAAAVPTPNATPSKKLITTFAGDKATLTSAMKSTISKWIKARPADAKIECKGSTSGVKITAFDKSLARSRAKNVCEYAKKIRPGISYTLKLNPSSANKPSARHVWMSFGY